MTSMPYPTRSFSGRLQRPVWVLPWSKIIAHTEHVWAEEVTMSEGTETRSVDRGLLWIRLIWIGLFTPLVFCLVIANVIGEQRTVTGGSPDQVFDLVKYVLYGFAAVLLVLVFIVRKAIHNRHSTVTRMMASLSPVMQYAVLILVAGGLCQAIAIYGLIAFLLDGGFLSLYALVGISAAALILLRPRKQDLVNLAVYSKSKRDS